MLTLVVRNLLRRPARTILTAAGVALGVGLIVALLSISTGVQRTAADLIHVGHADFGLFQADVSDFSRSLLPESLATKVAREPGVAHIAKLKLVASSGPKSFFVFGLDPHEFVWRRLVLLRGRFPSAGEALAGDKLGLRVGETLHVSKTKTFRVSGVYHSGDTFEDQGAVVPLRVAERLANRPGGVAAAKALEPRYPSRVNP